MPHPYRTILHRQHIKNGLFITVATLLSAGLIILLAGGSFNLLQTIPTCAAQSSCSARKWLCLDAKQKIPAIKCACKNLKECDDIPPLPQNWTCLTNQDAGQKDGTGSSNGQCTYWYYDHDSQKRVDVPPVHPKDPKTMPPAPSVSPPPTVSPLPLPASGCRIKNFESFQYYCQTGWGDQYPQRDQARWCGVASAAMLYTYANRNQSTSNTLNPKPPEVWNQCNWNWAANSCAAKLVPGGKINRGNFPTSATYFNKLQNLICKQGKPVIANLKRNGINHFVVVVGLTQNEVETADPWYGCSGINRYTPQPFPLRYKNANFYEMAGHGDNPYNLRWLNSR